MGDDSRLTALLEQRDKLRARAAELEAKVKALDMTDVSKAVSTAQKLNSELWSMEDVLENLEREIAKTRQAIAEAEQARLKAERGKWEGKDREAIKQVVGAVLRLKDDLGEYHQVQRDMHRVGASITEQLPERLGKAVEHVLDWWRGNWPELVGLPVPDVEAQMRKERADQIAGIEAELRRLQSGNLKDDERGNRDERIGDLKASLAFMKKGM